VRQVRFPDVQSETGNVLFAREASRRCADDGVIAEAVMPGGIWTNLRRHWDPTTWCR